MEAVDKGTLLVPQTFSNIMQMQPPNDFLVSGSTLGELTTIYECEDLSRQMCLLPSRLVCKDLTPERYIHIYST